MRNTVLFVLLLVSLAAAGVLIGIERNTAALGALGAAVVLAVVLYRGLALPLRTIRLGMDLLRSQDFASRLSPVGQRDADSMVALYNSIIDNIKQERLKNNEQNFFLASLIEASPMGIAICDFDGRIVERNPAFEALETPQLLDTLASLPADGRRTFRQGDTQVLRCTRRWFMDRGFRRPFFLVERLTDEIVKAETAMFNKIVRTMGHEVNNTMGGVISVLETMAAIHGDEPEVCQVLESCCDSCSKLAAFVRSYADIVKLPEPEMAQIDLNSFVADTLPFLQGLCPPGIKVEAALHPAPVNVMADAVLLQRVVSNAVKNSRESIGSGQGIITIATAPGMLQVVDNGPGLSAEAAQKVFSPFFSTKRADRGLGLMLIADILRKHRARFSLATAPDGLTRLEINFQRAMNF